MCLTKAFQYNNTAFYITVARCQTKDKNTFVRKVIKNEDNKANIFKLRSERITASAHKQDSKKEFKEVI